MNTQQINDDISLLIIGYDLYVDVWNHYFELLNKYWTNRPKTYLATNTLAPNYKNVEVIQCGEEAEWSRKVYNSLKVIPSEYVVLLLEDFFTTKEVDNYEFTQLVNFCRENNVDYCKLKNQSKIVGPSFMGKKHLHVIDKNTEYGISLQAAIWKKSFLQKLIGSGNYNAWIFELTQVKEKTHLKPDNICIADDRNILEITHAVVQSKYLRKAIRVFKNQGYKIDTSQREVMSSSEEFKYNLKCKMAEITPDALKPFFKKIGKKMNVDFVSDRQMKG